MNVFFFFFLRKSKTIYDLSKIKLTHKNGKTYPILQGEGCINSRSTAFSLKSCVETWRENGRERTLWPDQPSYLPDTLSQWLKLPFGRPEGEVAPGRPERAGKSRSRGQKRSNPGKTSAAAGRKTQDWVEEVGYHSKRPESRRGSVHPGR